MKKIIHIYYWQYDAVTIAVEYCTSVVWENSILIIDDGYTYTDVIRWECATL